MGDLPTQLVHSAARELLVDVVDGRGDVGECGREGVMASLMGRGEEGKGGIYDVGECGGDGVVAGLQGRGAGRGERRVQFP